MDEIERFFATMPSDEAEAEADALALDGSPASPSWPPPTGVRFRLAAERGDALTAIVHASKSPA